MSQIILAGPDPTGVAGRLDGLVGRIEGRATQSALKNAGIEEADILLMTDPNDGTAIPVAREMRPELRVIVYATTSIPDFARHQADLILDPALIDHELLLEELHR